MRGNVEEDESEMGSRSAQTPRPPRYREELPVCRLLLNNVQGVEEQNACNRITVVITMRLI